MVICVDKHGSCAASLDLLSTEHDFFSTALKLHSTIDVLVFNDEDVANN